MSIELNPLSTNERNAFLGRPTDGPSEDTGATDAEKMEFIRGKLREFSARVVPKLHGLDVAADRQTIEQEVENTLRELGGV